MAREYAQVPDFFMQLDELQPITPSQMIYSQYFINPGPNASTAPSFELIGSGGGAGQGGDGGATTLPPLPEPVELHGCHLLEMEVQAESRKRKNCHFSRKNSYEIGSASVAATSTITSQSSSLITTHASSAAATNHHAAASSMIRTAAASGKRKYSPGTGSLYEDDCKDETGSTRSHSEKKQNHSEIEKRRRDKMNTYISELSAMIPMCGAMSRKLDKLSVLRMAVQHMRSIRGAINAGPLTARPRPSFISEREMNTVILQAAQDCFLMVVGCERGKLLFVSTSVKNLLHFDKSELLGQSLFDLLHPKDLAKVKEQLSSSDLSPRERLVDAKTMLPLKGDVVADTSRLSPGARRSFFCRIKCRASCAATQAGMVKTEDRDHRKAGAERKYVVVQCTGYLKSQPSEMGEGANNAGVSVGDTADETGPSSISCLVAVGRVLPQLAYHHAQPLNHSVPRMPHIRPMQFMSRHATDGKFLFVDHRVTLALGFLPQELLGTSLYEHVSPPSLGSVALAHKEALLRRTPVTTPPYAFRRKPGDLADVQTHFKPFRNPWTKEVECLFANHTLVTEGTQLTPSLSEPAPVMFKHEGDAEMQRLIDSQIESHNIGSAIAEEALRHSMPMMSPGMSPDMPPDMLQDALFSNQSSLVDIIESDVTPYDEVRNNVPLSVARAESSPTGEGTLTVSEPHSAPESERASPPLPPLDGNGEAAMAVIMSLLEAEAGLGGPVNFSGLPWPLP